MSFDRDAHLRGVGKEMGNGKAGVTKHGDGAFYVA